VKLALGISVHTGWGACVVAGGDVRAPVVEVREDVEVLGEDERFVFHRAAELPAGEAARAIERARRTAVSHAKTAVQRLAQGREVTGCAVVAKKTPMPEPLQTVLAAHSRIHAAEGCFYRDVFREACEECGLEVRIVTPAGLDPNAAVVMRAGKAVGRPWGRDQKLAALAAWSLLSH
jgi:hypothetical protein